jgi:hypothetical protein
MLMVGTVQPGRLGLWGETGGVGVDLRRAALSPARSATGRGGMA